MKTTWIESKGEKELEIYADKLAKPINVIVVNIPATVKIENWGDFIDIYIEEHENQ